MHRILDAGAMIAALALVSAQRPTRSQPRGTGPHPGWLTYESPHFTFYYAADSKVLAKPGAIQAYAEKRERARANICKYLGIGHTKKIKFFAYDNNEIAKRIIGRTLGFAEPAIGVIHSRVNQTPGHEITHILSRSINGKGPPNRLLDEGLAVFLNQTGGDRSAGARALLGKGNLPTVGDMLRELPDRWYGPAGAFVGYLCEQHGVGKFKQLWGAPKDSFAVSFQRIYGKSIAEMDKEWRDYLRNYVGQPRRTVAPIQQK